MVKKPVSQISKDVGIKMRNIIRQTGNTLESTVALLKDVNNTSALSQYLNGIRNLSLETVVNFCNSFNISFDDILKENSSSYKNNSQTIDWQYILNLFDTINYYLKIEKAEMDDSEKIRLAQHIYENRIEKDNIIPTIKFWRVANPSIFRKTG